MACRAKKSASCVNSLVAVFSRSNQLLLTELSQVRYSDPVLFQLKVAMALRVLGLRGKMLALLRSRRGRIRLVPAQPR